MNPLQLLPPNSGSVWDEYVPITTEGRTTNAYLSDGIAEPAAYNELCHKLAQAYPGDTFIIHLNTPGGMIDSAAMLREAILNSKATTVAKLTGTVASAGTMIALACDELVLSRNLAFMCHEISVSGISGKFSDIKNMQAFYEKEFARLTADVYTGFLTPEEVASLHTGKELWFNEYEVAEKWAAFKGTATPQPESE